MPFPDITLCNLNSLATHPADHPAYREYLEVLGKVCSLNVFTLYFV